MVLLYVWRLADDSAQQAKTFKGGENVSIFMRFLQILIPLALGLTGSPCLAAEPLPAMTPVITTAAEGKDAAPLTKLGTGDTIAVQVYGQPDMSSTVYVADDGTVPIALVGSVKVSGLSPSQAGKAIEKALTDGGFLIEPRVSITVTTSVSQRVSVLGEVQTPGRYPIDSSTTIFDLLAQAGGNTENSSRTVYILRPDAAGSVKRFPVDLSRLTDSKSSAGAQLLQGGDSVFVPRAEVFYVYGEVTTPGNYRIEPGLTVMQAIALSGGITEKGSERRVEIKRRQADGKLISSRAKLGDLVQSDDVILVKESIF